MMVIAHTAPEFAQQHEQRWIELARMKMPALRAEYQRVMRAHNLTSLLGGPRSHSDHVSAILWIEREEAVRVYHLAEFGPGHEQCPTMNFIPTCPAMKERS